MSARNCCGLTTAKPGAAHFRCLRVSSAAQLRCFVRQHPRSAALVLAFLRPPRFSCCATAFLLLRNCVSFAVQPRCRFAITLFRVYFSSLVAAKGFVLLNIRARRLAPLVVIVRGAQLFLAFLSLVSGSLRPFLLTSAVFLRSDAEFSCRCAGFSVRRGCASLALIQAFATSCGALGLRVALSRFNAPLLECRLPLRLRSLRSGGKSAPIFHLSTICFPQSFPRCGENVHLSVRFSPPFRFSTAGRTDPLPSRGGKVPFARAYI